MLKLQPGTYAIRARHARLGTCTVVAASGKDDACVKLDAKVAGHAIPGLDAGVWVKQADLTAIDERLEAIRDDEMQGGRCGRDGQPD